MKKIFGPKKLGLYIENNMPLDNKKVSNELTEYRWGMTLSDETRAWLIQDIQDQGEEKPADEISDANLFLKWLRS